MELLNQRTGWRKRRVANAVTEKHPLLFSRRLAIADKLGVDLNTVTAVTREVEAAHGINWPFPRYPNPLDRGNRVPKFNPNNHEDAPL
jgi:hypothetical protein